MVCLLCCVYLYLHPGIIAGEEGIAVIRMEERGAVRELLPLCLFLLGMGLLLWLFPGEEPVPEPPLAERDGIRVLAGVPDVPGEERTFSRQVLLAGTLLPVGPEHPLPRDYPAPSTRTLRAQVGLYLPTEEETALRAEAIYALCEMQLARPMEDGAVLTVGAVSSAQQEEMLRDAFGRCLRVYPLEEAMAMARALVPGGGQSEHQTGLAVDVRLTGALEMGYADPLERNETGRWLSENMWRYGFIRRYTRDGEAGNCENIHLRFVGKIHAAAMHTLDISFEEYWALLKSTGGLTLERDGQRWAWVLCRPCDDAFTVSVPPGAECTASTDGSGCAVAAVLSP